MTKAPGNKKTPAEKTPEKQKAPAKKGQSPKPLDRKPFGRKEVRLGALLAGVLAVVFIAWLVFHDGDSGTPTTGPESATLESLRESASERGTPIYWAGPQEDAELEVTDSDGGERVYVRYLTGGAEPGDPRPKFLTIGTYVYPGAAEALKRQAKETGGELKSAPGGATVYINPDHPQSVYLAYPGVGVEIEVYDPNPQRALNLVTAGQIVPVA
jgi:hypothetical protein